MGRSRKGTLKSREFGKEKSRVGVRQRNREQALQAILAGIVESSDDAIITKTTDGTVTTWNAGAEKIFGYRAEEIVGKPVSMLIPSESPNEEPEILARILGGEHIRHYETVRIRKDGKRIDVSLTVSPIRDAAGNIVAVSKIARDISDRKRAEDALRKSEERYLGMLEGALKGICQATIDGRILFANPALATMLGFDSPSELTSGITDLAHQLYVDPERRAELIRKLLAEGSVRDFELQMRRKDGRVIWVATHDRLVRRTEGGIWIVDGLVEDITERKLAQERLQKSEHEYRILFDHNPSPMWVCDAETLAFLAVNDAAVKHYGYSREEFLEMTVRDIRPAHELPRFAVHVAKTIDHEVPMGAGGAFQHRKKDGTLIDVEVAASSILFQNRKARLVLANDVSERTNLQEQLRQSQKLEAIGELAGGVAHDFNNLLTVVSGYGEMLLADVPEGSPLLEAILPILEAGERAAALTRQLLAFSRKTVLKSRVLDINAVVADAQKLLTRLIGEDMVLKASLDPELVRVRVDPDQFGQVLINLAVNARDAMSQGGKMTIETRNVELDKHYVSTHAEIAAGRYALLAVSDTGSGMAPEVAARVFEPFFTTKGAGKGTGLGLSVVHGIVKQSGGSIEVYSEPGIGTTFKIYLPAVDEPLEPTRRTAAGGIDLRGSETILVAEDEEAVRTFVLKTLRASGYDTLYASNGPEALRIARQHPGTIALLMTDVVMPEMNGRELGDRFLRLFPEAKVLYLSGYTNDAVVRHGILHAEVNFLQKPFTSVALLTKVRQMLGERQRR